MMISNFEKRLASLEKNNPCESDRDILILIDKLIAEEMAKGDEQDSGLIAEAVSFALSLKGGDADGAASSAEEALAYVKRKSTRRTRAFRPRRMAALMAAVMLIAALSVGVYAFIKKRFDMENITKEEFETIEKNQNHTEEDMDYYISDKVALYDTVDDMLSDGQIDMILYPETLPEGYEQKSITATELETYKELRFIFEGEGAQVQMVVETPATRELYFPDKPVGGYTVSVIGLESGYQVEFIYDECIYTFISPSVEAAEEFILTLSERGAK